MKTYKLLRIANTLLILTIALVWANQSSGQYLGVTCGYQYSAQLTGPLTYPDQYNISMFNPMGGSQYDPNNPTWGVWVEELTQAGVDFVCPNCTGSWPNTNSPPTQIAPMVAAVNARGLTDQLKFALFDDNAASWCAQYNLSIGDGYGYATPMDLSNTNNWKFIYDYNYKLFYETVPDANRFKINGRPLIIIWSSGPLYMTNTQGNLSRALMYVRQCCQRDFGFNPFIVDDSATTQHDTTCTNAGVLDGMQGWFIAGPSGPSYSLTTYNGNSIGVCCAEFQHPGQSGYLDPDHGELFENGLNNTVGAGALVTLCEGFTDYEEDAAMWRCRDMDTNGNPLSYSQTLYDYPNQRIDILRAYSGNPFPFTMQYAAVGCDWYGGANGGNDLTNYYRNGNIAIQPTTDAGGGFNVGWIQSGEWLEWTNVPLNGTPDFVMRVASPNTGAIAHFVIDGVAEPSQAIPNTGGWQTYTTVDFGPYGTYNQSYHDVRLVFDNGGENINWWGTQTSGGPAFSSGTFTSDSVLNLVGSSSQELFGVTLGDSSSQQTANGYTFGPYPSAYITYGGSGAYAVSGFLGGGGTSGDSVFDTVLNDAELGINNGVITLQGLTPGTTYNVLFLEADTRGGVGSRTFQITSGTASSANQSYAFEGGSPALGGYVLCTFTATGTTQTFTNTAAGYGYQLNAVLVGIQSTNSTFTSGTFTSDSVLSLVGSPSQELFGVTLGDSSSQQTANGYTFGPYPSAYITYGGSGAYAVSGFLGGGGTSGDSVFDTVLDDAELGINNGVITLQGLTPGTTYHVLFLEADTRSGVGSRTVQITTGSASSANQSYAFQGGSPALGGYVFCTFTATGSTQTFTNTAVDYGYQLNAILVGQQ